MSTPGPEDEVFLLDGSATLEEEMLGLRFRISPSAFFQVNTPGAEVLFRKVAEWADIASGEGVVVDVCCGTGTIGLSMAAHCSRVVGVEMVEAAVEDARFNAALNDISNATFVAGKAEDVLAGQLDAEAAALPMGLTVGVVDPPRGGLHPKVIKALRKCEPMKRLVYVSCNPTGSFVEDAVRLCLPKIGKVRGQPFRPVRAVPVDMFPHTKHCEMVVLFERD
eukprot:PLAT1495.2.p1 GENE.PLAT1495.2~~PLAT1495.2.p1  ORF type:complete len:222 (-),score=71.35 PLAT1495.2:79-744(-)